MKVNWIALWMKLFGTTQLFGLNMGFWVSMTVVLLIVILMSKRGIAYFDDLLSKALQ